MLLNRLYNDTACIFITSCVFFISSSANEIWTLIKLSVMSGNNKWLTESSEETNPTLFWQCTATALNKVLHQTKRGRERLSEKTVRYNCQAEERNIVFKPV